jgi:hypothetical protein
MIEKLVKTDLEQVLFFICHLSAILLLLLGSEDFSG